MRYSDPRLVDSLAAAYVLGTLAGPARRRFERLARERGDVDLAVAAWEQRLGALAQAVPPKAAPERVWRAIEQRTRHAAAAPAAARPASSWWWPAGFGFGGLVAGALATFALLYVTPALFLSADQVALRSGGKLPQSYVGLLTDAQGNGKLLVSSLRHGRTMTIKVIGPIAPPPAGQRLVLWALPSQGAPFVLGDVPASGSAASQLAGTSEQLLSKVTKLAVTLESEGVPAVPGPAVYTGNCAKLW
jgi:anti-sigma-K factor RskA